MASREQEVWAVDSVLALELGDDLSCSPTFPQAGPSRSGRSRQQRLWCFVALPRPAPGISLPHDWDQSPGSQRTPRTSGAVQVAAESQTSHWTLAVVLPLSLTASVRLLCLGVPAVTVHTPLSPHAHTGAHPQSLQEEGCHMEHRSTHPLTLVQRSQAFWDSVRP